jgi:hypothetical protein
MDDSSTNIAVVFNGYQEGYQVVENGASTTICLNANIQTTATDNQSGPANGNGTEVTVLDSKSLDPISGALLDYNDSQLGQEQLYTQVDGTALLPIVDPYVLVAVTASGYFETNQEVENHVNATFYLTEAVSNTTYTQVTVIDSQTQLPVAGAIIDYNDSVLGAINQHTLTDGTALLVMHDPSENVAVTDSGYSQTNQVVYSGMNATIDLEELNQTG